jgi:hypothetical protein
LGVSLWAKVIFHFGAKKGNMFQNTFFCIFHQKKLWAKMAKSGHYYICEIAVFVKVAYLSNIVFRSYCAIAIFAKVAYLSIFSHMPYLVYC